MARQRTLLGGMLAALAALSLGQLLSQADFRQPETALVTSYTGTSAYVQGVVIRQETPVTADPAVPWTPALSDGERAAAGQVLLREEPKAQTEILARRVRLLRAGADTAELPLTDRREAIHEAVAALNAASGAKKKSCSETLAGSLLGETELSALRLTAAETALRNASEETVRTVAAPASGIVVSGTDGLEEILTPEHPWARWSLPVRPADPEYVGRLITGDTWYFRTELPFTPAAGDVLIGSLPWSGEALALTVEEVRPGGAVLLSCGRMLSEVAAVRQLEMKIMENCETGLEIPANAVYTVEGETGVWRLQGEAAQFRSVTVLRDLGETVVVLPDPEDPEALEPGDRVLLAEQ